ncbi:hypothetical protein BGZ98_003724, partial [Dissophora globulifera]
MVHSPRHTDSAAKARAAAAVSVPKVTRIVFTALLLDILAFTIILPLFPRLLQFYRDSEHGDQTSLLAWSLTRLTEFQNIIGLNDPHHRHAATDASSVKRPPKMDIVLLGGALGSLFSVLQFVASPIIGKLSDVLGRRRVLLISMLGNLVSCGVWLFASSFELFVLSRIIGGLSEGNVQLSIAMISDITTPATRSRGLAMVGIAFAIAFTVGPALGAYFANKDLVAAFPGLAQYGLHPFSGSALLAMVLLTVESLYLYAKLPETNSESWRLAVQQTTEDERKAKADDQESTSVASKSSTQTNGSSRTTTFMDAESIVRLQHSYLRRLSFTHFAHLFLFSGMEFTLTFLTFHLFDFTHMQQGALLGYIGILSSLIQGGYVRRRANVVGEKRMVLQGMIAAALGLGCIALVSSGGGSSIGELAAMEETTMPAVFKNAVLWLKAQDWSRSTKMWGLYAGATGLAVTSATVVNCLTSLASLVCDMGSDSPSLSQSNGDATAARSQPIGKGLALGRFRSWGQLGRAAGPIAAWPLVCYGAASLAVAGLAVVSSRILPEVRKLPIRTKVAVESETKKTRDQLINPVAIPAGIVGSPQLGPVFFYELLLDTILFERGTTHRRNKPGPSTEDHASVFITFQDLALDFLFAQHICASFHQSHPKHVLSDAMHTQLVNVQLGDEDNMRRHIYKIEGCHGIFLPSSISGSSSSNNQTGPGWSWKIVLPQGGAYSLSSTGMQVPLLHAEYIRRFDDLYAKADAGAQDMLARIVYSLRTERWGISVLSKDLDLAVNSAIYQYGSRYFKEKQDRLTKKAQRIAQQEARAQVVPVTVDQHLAAIRNQLHGLMINTNSVRPTFGLQGQVDLPVVVAKSDAYGMITTSMTVRYQQLVPSQVYINKRAVLLRKLQNLLDINFPGEGLRLEVFG